LTDTVSDVPKVFTYPRDPDDEPQINLAVAAGVRYLVTWDNDLLDLMSEKKAAGSDFRQRFPQLLILTPVALIREISAVPSASNQTE
jgi:predicted nucleic acid-binding protein